MKFKTTNERTNFVNKTYREFLNTDDNYENIKKVEFQAKTVKVVFEESLNPVQLKTFRMFQQKQEKLFAIKQKKLIRYLIKNDK